MYSFIIIQNFQVFRHFRKRKRIIFMVFWSFQKVLALQMREGELVVYEPHCYADEGKPTASSELDAISISEDDFHPDMLKTLDNRFSQLATISRPDLMRR